MNRFRSLKIILFSLLVSIFLVGCGDRRDFGAGTPSASTQPTIDTAGGPLRVGSLVNGSVAVIFEDQGFDADQLLRGPLADVAIQGQTNVQSSAGPGLQPNENFQRLSTSGAFGRTAIDFPEVGGSQSRNFDILSQQVPNQPPCPRFEGDCLVLEGATVFDTATERSGTAVLRICPNAITVEITYEDGETEVRGLEPDLGVDTNVVELTDYTAALENILNSNPAPFSQSEREEIEADPNAFGIANSNLFGENTLLSTPESDFTRLVNIEFSKSRSFMNSRYHDTFNDNVPIGEHFEIVIQGFLFEDGDSLDFRYVRLSVDDCPPPTRAPLPDPDPLPDPTPTPDPTPSPDPSPTPDPTPECQSAARWEVAASETDSVTLIPVANNVTFHGGQAVTLNPGENFQQVFETPIEGLNYIIIFNNQEFDQGFEIEVPCGKIQIFTFSGGVSFGQEDFP